MPFNEQTSPIGNPTKVNPNFAPKNPANAQPLKISYSRNGSSLTVNFSLKLPEAVISLVKNIMENAAAFHPVPKENNPANPKGRKIPVMRDFEVAKPSLGGNNITPTFTSNSVTVVNIIPALDNAVINVIGAGLIIWQKYGSDPQPSVSTITFSDDEGTNLYNHGGEVTSLPYTPDDGAVESEPWVTGLMATGADFAVLGVEAALGLVENVGEKAGEITITGIADQAFTAFESLLDDISKSPDVPPQTVPPQTLNMSSDITDETMGNVPDMGANTGDDPHTDNNPNTGDYPNTGDNPNGDNDPDPGNAPYTGQTNDSGNDGGGDGNAQSGGGNDDAPWKEKKPIMDETDIDQ